VADLSKSDLGLIAERIPIGSAIRSQVTAPPTTSEIVTGAAVRTSVRTLCSLRNELPSDAWARCQTKRAYWR
jgi:hypothetical protein